MVAETFSNIVFDFEDELSHVSDPALDERTKELMKKDRRFKTVVCRHWVKGLCMKLDNCEFLHELNIERMPECRWGEKCQIPDCPFKHTKEQDRLECSYYNLGFCMHGTGCRYRHVRKAPEECPDVLQWDELPTASAGGIRRVTEPNENFKIQLCRHFMQKGSCPFGDKCHFAHGEQELRKAAPRVRKPDEAMRSMPVVPSGPTPLELAIKKLQASAEVTGNPLADLGEDLKTPDRDIEEVAGRPMGPVRYFILRSQVFDHLAASVRHGIWSVHPHLLERLNEAFFTSKQVVFIYTVNESREFVGSALMTSPLERFDKHANVECPPEAQGVSFVCKVKWTRTCVLPYKKTAMIETAIQEIGRELPIPFAFEGTELSPEVGHALLVMLYREPAIEIAVEQIDASLKLAVHMPGPSPDLIPILHQTDEQLHLQRQQEHMQPQASSDPSAANKADDEALIAPGSIPIHRDGFVFVCEDPRHLDEMFGRCLLGAPESKLSEVKPITPGTVLIVRNRKDGMLFGVFEATAPAQRSLEPASFLGPDENGNPKCMLPVQVPMRIVLDVPPFNVNQVSPHVIDHAPNAPCQVIEKSKMQQVVNLFAIKAGLPVQQPMGNFSPDVPPGVSVQPPQQAPNGNIGQTITINIPFKQQFKAAHRLIGKSGANMKRISQETGVTCRVRGVNDSGNDREISGAIVLVLSAKTQEELAGAVALSKEIIDDLIRQHEDYLERGEQMRNARLAAQNQNRPPGNQRRGGQFPPPHFRGGPPRGPPRGPPHGPPRGPPRGGPRDGPMGGPRGPPHHGPMRDQFRGMPPPDFDRPPFDDRDRGAFEDGRDGRGFDERGGMPPRGQAMPHGREKHMGEFERERPPQDGPGRGEHDREIGRDRRDFRGRPTDRRDLDRRHGRGRKSRSRSPRRRSRSPARRKRSRSKNSRRRRSPPPPRRRRR